MQKKRISKLKSMILYILKEFPKSRDSDSWLTCKLWAVYFPSKIERDENGKNPKVRLENILDLPREDHIKRIRAVIQNEENRFLPTTLEVVKQRKINEEKWRSYLLRQPDLFEDQ